MQNNKMMENKEIRLSLSKDNYKTKEEVKATLTKEGAKSIGKQKLMFREEITTLPELIEKLTDGYCFCSLFNLQDTEYIINGKLENPYYKNEVGYFKLKFKRNEFFKGSQILPIDVDKTNYTSANNFISTLTNKPTFSYYTYSDKPENRRFRLMYIFDDVLNYKQIKTISKAINKQIEKDTNEALEDKCNEVPAQYFNGTKSKDIFRSDIIYNYKTLLESLPEDTTEEVKEEVKKSIELKPKKEVVEVTIDERLIDDMENESYDEFMSHNRPKYRLFYRSEGSDWIDDKYQIVKPNFYKLFYNREKVSNGNSRRKKLYNRMLQRLYTYPDLTPEDILVNAYEDLHLFFDNSDSNDFITIDCLVKNVKSAFQKSREEIKEVLSGWIEWNDNTRPSIILKKGVGKGNSSKQCKEIRYSEIEKYYNPLLTDKENLDILSNNGICICKRTLANFKKSIQKEGKKERNRLILSLFDDTKTMKENLSILKDNNISISKRTLQRIVNNPSTEPLNNQIVESSYNQIEEPLNSLKTDNIMTLDNLTSGFIDNSFEKIQISNSNNQTNTFNDSEIDFSNFYKTTSNYLSSWNINNKI